MEQEQWQRYIDNTATQEEREKMLKWLLEESWDQELTIGWESPAPFMPQEVSDRLLATLITHPAFLRWGLRRKRRIWWSAAASLLLILGGIGWWSLRETGRNSAIALTQQLRNKSRHVELVTLQEGSQVWLAPGSTLDIPGDFNFSTRQLELEGEAYFEVTHNQYKPFRVKTAKVQTTVLGTHFNIEAYKGEAEIKVSLISGRVNVVYATVTGKDSCQMLSPGTRIVYKTAERRGVLEKFIPEAKEAEWRKGALIFENIPLSAVFSRLENRFGKKFIYSPSIFSKKYFSAAYENVSPEIILRNIAFIHGFHYEVRGDSILIH